MTPAEDDPLDPFRQIPVGLDPDEIRREVQQAQALGRPRLLIQLANARAKGN